VDAITVTKHGRTRFWAVWDAAGDLICVCVYKRGAYEVARRLTAPAEIPGAYLLHDSDGSHENPAEPLSKLVREGL